MLLGTLSVVLRIIFILYLVLEISVFLNLAAAFGWGPVLLAMLLTTVLGYVLLRTQGRAALARMTEMSRGGELPSEVMEAVMARLGAAFLLLMPGFVSDLAGLIMLLPLARPMARRILGRRRRPGGPEAGSFQGIFWSVAMGTRPGAVPSGGERRVRGRTGEPDKVVEADFEVLE